MTTRYDLGEYNREFFEDNQREQYILGNFLIPKFINLFNPNSFLDVGCGAAGHVDVWTQHNVKGYGIEGSMAAKDLSPNNVNGNILYADLRDKLDVPAFDNIDLLQSFEVAEHIEEDFADTYVHNMVIHNPKYIVMTAAGLHQLGTFHVNCQKKEYWVDRITQSNYNIREDLENKILSWGRPPAGPRWWPENLMVFSREQ